MNMVFRKEKKNQNKISSIKHLKTFLKTVPVKGYMLDIGGKMTFTLSMQQENLAERQGKMKYS